MSIQFLDFFPDLSKELYPILWPRIWAWMQFLDTHDHCLAESRSNSAVKDVNRAHYLLKIREIMSDQSTAELVASTRGVWTMVAGMWATCIERNSFARGFSGAQVLCEFIRDPRAASHMDEFIETLGGTTLDLVMVVIKHIKLVAVNPEHPLTPSSLYYLFPALKFLQGIISASLVPREVLLAAGTTKALVDTTCALTRIEDDQAGELLPICLYLLCQEERSGMASALKSGLLHAIVACGTHSKDPADPNLRLLLGLSIWSSLVCYSVLRRMPKALRQVQTTRLEGHPIFPDWTNFIELVNARLAVVRSFESPSRIPLRACDNVKHLCPLPGKYYCSTQCQRVDWRDGAHRGVCEQLVADRPKDLNRRDLSFLRVLLHHDYERQKHDIWLKQIAFMHAHPSTDFYVLFHYTQRSSPVHITVHPVSNPPGGPHRRFQFNLTHAKASGGRIELHYVGMWDSFTQSSGLCFPMRSSSPALSRGLRDIANELAPDADISELQEQILEWVRALEESAEVIQIH
ncbi:hypothetical protein FB451DRAFT_1536128 [Mycena latifolia]|nr:hypothetical protein FB451DRAFT_1536128 [Mycena latifolia]